MRIFSPLSSTITAPSWSLRSLCGKMSKCVYCKFQLARNTAKQLFFVRLQTFGCIFICVCICIFKNFLLRFLEKLKFNLHTHIYFFIFLQFISDNFWPSFQVRCLDRIRGGCVVMHVTAEMRDYNFYKQPLWLVKMSSGKSHPAGTAQSKHFPLHFHGAGFKKTGNGNVGCPDCIARCWWAWSPLQHNEFVAFIDGLQSCSPADWQILIYFALSV